MDVFDAIADPVRREILEMIGRRELSAGEIAEAFEISRPAVSRHLRVLRESGLVVDEMTGRHRLYRLNVAGLGPVVEWLDQLGASRWDDALAALETEVYRTRRDRREAQSETDRRSA